MSRVGVGGWKENKTFLRKIREFIIDREMVPHFCVHYFLPFLREGARELRIGER